MYLYVSMCIYCFSVNKGSFKGPGGVGRGLDPVSRAKICALELVSVVSVVPRSLPLPTFALLLASDL